MILTKSPILRLDPAEPMPWLAHVPQSSDGIHPVLCGQKANPLLLPDLFSAVFNGFDNPKMAEGTFSDSVGFKKPGLEKNRNLITRQIDLLRIAATDQKSQPETYI